MRFHVVTTMNSAGWEQTGRRMAQSFVERWPDEAKPLTVYAEGFVPDVEGVEVRRLPDWMEQFKRDHGSVPSRVGMRNGRYCYINDAVKFAHKVAAVTDFGLSLDDGVMIWLDADTFTHADVTVGWLQALFPEPAYLAWLDRVSSHPECGFVMYRCSHPYHLPFMEAYRDLYTSGNLFKLPETNDCSALAHIVGIKVANRHIPNPVSLSGDKRWHHPFVNGPLGQCLDHLKGARKDEGRSRAIDMRKPRSEPYWAGKS